MYGRSCAQSRLKTMSETSKFDPLKYSRNIKPDDVFLATADTDYLKIKSTRRDNVHVISSIIYTPVSVTQVLGRTYPHTHTYTDINTHSHTLINTQIYTNTHLLILDSIQIYVTLEIVIDVTYNITSMEMVLSIRANNFFLFSFLSPKAAPRTLYFGALR